NPEDYYRLIISGLLLVMASCTGSFDPLLPVSGVNVDSVLGTESSKTTEDADLPECLELGGPASDIHLALFEALNLYRAENGLEPLIYSQKLEAVADAHLQDTWNRDYFAHINPEGQEPGDRAFEAGFCHRYVGENLAAGQRSVESVMKAWKDSPTHDQNMLREGYVYVGMGYFEDPLGRKYWAQSFAYDVP
ncbi:MAG: CAP domain-containing protein, partial [Planctomycetota bacterium]